MSQRRLLLWLRLLTGAGFMYLGASHIQHMRAQADLFAAHAAWQDPAAQQPVAGHALVQPKKPFADAKAMRVGDRIAGVIRNHAEVGHVVVEPLEFEEHDAKIPGPVWHDRAGAGLERLTIRQRVADRRVARHALGQFHARRWRPASPPRRADWSCSRTSSITASHG